MNQFFDNEAQEDGAADDEEMEGDYDCDDDEISDGKFLHSTKNYAHINTNWVWVHFGYILD